MKDKRAEAEYANRKINEILNGEEEENTLDVSPMINNNNPSLVLKNVEKEKDDLDYIDR